MSTQLFYDTIIGKNPKEADIIEIIKKEDFDSTYTNNMGVTVLQGLVHHDMVKAIEIFLDKGGIDINARDRRFGCTALHKAVANMFTRSAEVLLKRGADVNSCATIYPSLSSILHAAVYQDHREMIKLLFRYHVDPNLKNYFGKNALSESKSEIVTMMIMWYEWKLWSDFLVLI